MDRGKLLFELLLISIIFIIGLIIQPFVYNGFQDSQIHSIYCETTTPDLGTTSFSENIELTTPLHSNFELHPAVILLHGDDLTSDSLNLLKMEFLRNGYMVVTLNITSYDCDVYFILNDTLNYLLSRTDVNSSQIGIFGHSRGADYATFFATYRNNSIHGVIAANIGSIQEMESDYCVFYKNIMANNSYLPDIYSGFIKENMSLPLNATTPNNLLLIADKFDIIVRANPNLYFKNYTDGAYNQNNKLYGNFNKGTARELIIENSLYGHLAGILSSTGIYDAISWMNRALHVPNASNNHGFAFFLSIFATLPYFLLIGGVVVINMQKYRIVSRLKLLISKKYEIYKLTMKERKKRLFI